MFGGRDVSGVASCSGVLSWLEDRDDEMGDGRGSVARLVGGKSAREREVMCTVDLSWYKTVALRSSSGKLGL